MLAISPEISEHPEDAVVVRNEPVTLSCKASGNPQPQIDWFKDGELVRTAPDDPVSHRIKLPDGSLFFLRAMQSKKEQDAGTYWCVASSPMGVVRSNNATLEIACKSPSSIKYFLPSEKNRKSFKKIRVRSESQSEFCQILTKRL